MPLKLSLPIESYMYFNANFIVPLLQVTEKAAVHF